MMKLKEAYMKYDAAKDGMYYHSEGSSISMNSSDEFYVQHKGQWHWTKLCWSQERGWYIGAFLDWDIQTGEKIPVAVQDLFEERSKPELRNYDWWEHGIWISDGHNWNLDMDVPREKRIPTGETVVLQPPRLLEEVPPLTCEIYKLERCDLYIAIGHYKGLPVLFYDKISYSREYKRRYPDRQLAEEDWDRR